MKPLLGLHSAPPPHWVGDGFRVHSMFMYDNHGRHLSPFLMLDYGAPARFPAAIRPRGVGQHPHRGFETVTIAYQGEIEHRDSSGGGGVIGPGDVQWMTAARGILHDEFHSHEFTRRGGVIEMAQLWVNLPARHKSAAPGYQSIQASDIPRVTLPDGAGSVRVIAGEYTGQRGPARTFTPIEVWDITLAAGGALRASLPPGRTLGLVVMRGEIRANGSDPVRTAQMLVFGRDGTGLALEATTDASVLLLAGQPIDEPVAGYGPFVMNTREEIGQAVDDFNRGRFGQLNE